MIEPHNSCITPVFIISFYCLHLEAFHYPFSLFGYHLAFILQNSLVLS